MSIVDNLHVQVAFTTAPDDPAPAWTDITPWVDLAAGVSITKGRADEFATAQTGSMTATLNNSDGRFTPGNTASPYYPNVLIRKKIRVWHQDGAGPVSYRFTGYVEEWPCEWPGGNAYTTSQVTASDRFKRLGGIAKLRSIIEQEYLSDLPLAYFTLGEPEGSTTAGDTSKNGGSSLTTAQAGTGGVLTFGANTGPGTDGMTAPAFTPVNATNGRYLAGSIPYVAGVTARTLEAFALTTAATLQAVVSVSSLESRVELAFTAAGNVNAIGYADSTGSTYFNLTSAATFNNGATHHLAVTQSLAGGVVTVNLVVDGVSVASTTYAAAALESRTLLTVGYGRTIFSAGVFAGTISHVAVHTTALTTARLLAHYQAGSSGFAGERSDQRIARLARYAGVAAGEQSLEMGLSTIAHVDIGGATAVQAMQDVAATEGGLLYINGAGLLTFHARSHRYNTVSTLTIPATAVGQSAKFITNDSQLVNDVTASRPGGITFRAVNAASVAAYGTSDQSLTLLVDTDQQVVDAANWAANRVSEIKPRLPNLSLDLLTLPSLAAQIMLLALGARVTVSGLPTQAPAASVDLFVEGANESISLTEWTLSLNTSPASDSAAWVLDSPVYSQLGVSTTLAY